MKKKKQGGIRAAQIKHAKKLRLFMAIPALMIMALFAVAMYHGFDGHSIMIGSHEIGSAVLQHTSSALAFAPLGLFAMYRDPGTGGAGGGAGETELLEKIKKEVKSLIPGDLITSKEVKSLQDKLEELEKKSGKPDKYDELVTEHIDLMKEVKSLKEKGATTEKPSLVKELKSHSAKIRELANGGSGEVELKAIANRAIIANNEWNYDLPDLGQLATRKLSMYDLFPKLTVGDGNNAGVIRYYDWDEATKVRAAAMIAEGGIFPESTAAFTKGTLALQKVGDTLPITEEFMTDETLFASELGLFLETNVNLKIDDELCNGDGTGNNLKGLFASTPAYVPVNSGIQDASIYDLIVKLKEGISKNGGAKYTPDFAVMNITDINKMKLKKDTYNNYILPPFVSRDGQIVDGITVIESNIVPANEMVLGDRRFGRIYEKAGVTMEKGMVNDQFLKDEMTLKVRKRLAFLIRNADASGFLKVTSISSALTTLATA